MRKFNFLSLSLIVISISIIACRESSTNKVEDEIRIESVFEIVTNTMDFHCADTIPSGWTRIKYVNKSEETHFVLLERMPEGTDLTNFRKEIAPVFQDGMNLIAIEDMDGAMAKFGELPEWYQNVVYTGGTGLISPNSTAYSTIDLEPGYYVIECYVKMSSGIFHSAMGMSKALIVSEESNENTEPEATVNLRLSSTEGMSLDTTINSGDNVISVEFVDQKLYENFLGHDVHLVALRDSSSLDSLNHWMNWMHTDGLITPAPSGIQFLGGINDMPAGSKAYFMHNFEPGNYAFISEVADARASNLLMEFKVE